MATNPHHLYISWKVEGMEKLTGQVSVFTCCCRDLPINQRKSFTYISADNGISVAHGFEEHAHSTHGHKATIPSRRGEDREDAHGHRRAENEGTSILCSHCDALVDLQ